MTILVEHKRPWKPGELKWLYDTLGQHDDRWKFHPTHKFDGTPDKLEFKSEADAVLYTLTWE